MKTVLFDLDGTLLHMDIDAFVKAYFKALGTTFGTKGYDVDSIMKGLGAGLEAMIRNDGSASNETVFWKVFSSYSGYTLADVEADFLEFYAHGFDECAALASMNPLADAMVKKCKAAGYQVILATNPLFPKVATEKRIRWAGCDPDDFEWITTYENSSFSKPNPAYFKEIMDRFDLKAEDCMMIGNDLDEDGIIETLNVPCFLTTDCLLNKHQRELSVTWVGTFEELYNKIGGAE